MAAMSLRLRPTARYPICSAVDLRVKCTPSMLKSVVNRRSAFDGVGTTAQSPPISGARRRSFLTIVSSVTRRSDTTRRVTMQWPLPDRTAALRQRPYRDLPPLRLRARELTAQGFFGGPDQPLPEQGLSSNPPC